VVRWLTGQRIRACPFSFLRLRLLVLFFAPEELFSDFPPDAVVSLDPLIVYLDQSVPVTLREFRAEGFREVGRHLVFLDAPHSVKIGVVVRA
jgi:hypothetical protein